MKHRLYVGSFMLLGLVVSSVVAQTGMAQLDTSQVAIIPRPLAETQFTRYRTPGECGWASVWLENTYWRDKRQDTMYYPAAGRPLQTSTQRTIRGCAARYTVANTPAAALLGLAQAALASGSLRQADSAMARLAEHVASQPPMVQAWSYYQMVDVYLNAPEPRVVEAEHYTGKLDAIGAPVAVPCMLAHLRLVDEAEHRDSLSLWRREADAALAASHQITGDAAKDYAPEMASAYWALAFWHVRQNDVASARAVLADGRTALIPIRPSVEMRFDAADGMLAMLGRVGGPVQATRWIIGGTPGLAHPVAGMPALLVFISAHCRGYCYLQYAELRRLVARYPASQLDVILVANTEGWWAGHVVPADSEMASIQDYYTRVLKLPVNVGIWKTEFRRLPDGRQAAQALPTEQAYGASPGMVILLDKQGAIRMSVALDPHNETMLNDLVQSVM